MADAQGSRGHRCAVLVGPYLSGKTTLLEAMLYASGSTQRRGSVRDGTSVGDHVAEARARQMSTEMNVANATYLFALPGSPSAARDGWEEILKFQLDNRLRPCNLVELMPRLNEHLKKK